MLTAAIVFAALAAVLHVAIWWLESFTWTRPRTRAVFGTSEEEANTTRALAFNQGFYNLFLAIVTLAGVAALAVGSQVAGVALMLAGAGSMVAAALVLGATGRLYRRAALTQGALPALALVCLALAAVI